MKKNKPIYRNHEHDPYGPEILTVKRPFKDKHSRAIYNRVLLEKFKIRLKNYAKNGDVEGVEYQIYSMKKAGIYNIEALKKLADNYLLIACMYGIEPMLENAKKHSSSERHRNTTDHNMAKYYITKSNDYINHVLNYFSEIIPKDYWDGNIGAALKEAMEAALNGNYLVSVGILSVVMSYISNIQKEILEKMEKTPPNMRIKEHTNLN